MSKPDNAPVALINKSGTPRATAEMNKPPPMVIVAMSWYLVCGMRFLLFNIVHFLNFVYY
jgi:hypothetical protein